MPGSYNPNFYSPPGGQAPPPAPSGRSASAPGQPPAPPPAPRISNFIAPGDDPNHPSFTADVQTPTYKRPDGSTGKVGDGQAGDPQTRYGGSSFAGETPGDLTTTYDKDFMYGRDPNYAQNMANSALAGGNSYAQQFGTLTNQALASGASAQGTAQGYAGNEWNRGVNSFAANDRLTGQETALAGSIAGDNSAAQAQMQQGLNQSEASNLALARSGRGWGQSGSALGQAVNANAVAGQKASTDAALMKERQQEFATGVYGQAAGQAQQAGLADTGQAMQSSQFGATTGLQSQQVAGSQLQAGAGEAFAGLNASKAFTDAQQQSDLTREQLAQQQYATDSGVATAGAQLQEQKDSRIGGYIGAGIGAVGGAAAGFFGGGGVGAVPGAIAGASGGYQAGSAVSSDTDAKKGQAEAKGFAKGVQSVGQQLQQPTAAQRVVSGAMSGAAPWLAPNISSISGGVNIGRALAASQIGAPGADPTARAARIGTLAGVAAGHEADQAGRPAVNFDPFAKYDQQRAHDLKAHQIATGNGSGQPTPTIDQSTVHPATSSQAYGAKEYGVQNPEAPETYLPPAAGAPATPMGASQPWLDNYMAQQGFVTSDVNSKMRIQQLEGHIASQGQAPPPAPAPAPQSGFQSAGRSSPSGQGMNQQPSPGGGFAARALAAPPTGTRAPYQQQSGVPASPNFAPRGFAAQAMAAPSVGGYAPYQQQQGAAPASANFAPQGFAAQAMAAPPVGGHAPYQQQQLSAPASPNFGGSMLSDTQEKRSKERGAGFAEAMQQLDSNQGAFGGTNNETTQLAPAQEAAFQQWAKRSGIRDLDDPRSHYDYRGAYLAGMRPSANMHWPDTFKQHGHPTFSVESKYSAGPDDGGSWDGETYTPQRTTPRVDVDALDAAQRSQGGPVNDLRPAVGYTYQYKDPTMPGAKPGRVAGPMAQDLEHTIAADAVQDTPQGKMVNTPRLTMHNTSAIGEQQTEIEKLKAQLDALASNKPAAYLPTASVPRVSRVNPQTLTRLPDAGAY